MENQPIVLNVTWPKTSTVIAGAIVAYFAIGALKRALLGDQVVVVPSGTKVYVEEKK